MLTVESIADDLLYESNQDYVGLWQICRRVRSMKPGNPVSEKQLVLEVVRILLQSGLRAVQYSRSDQAYLPWPEQDPQYVTKRISDELDALGREPNLGDIVCFDNLGSKMA